MLLEEISEENNNFCHINGYDVSPWLVYNWEEFAKMEGFNVFLGELEFILKNNRDHHEKKESKAIGVEPVLLFVEVLTSV